MKEKMVIRFRFTDAATVRLLEAGHPPKPGFLKMKTIDKEDVMLGANKSDIGKVGYFEPELPKNFHKLAEANPKLQKRFDSRLKEWKDTAMQAEVKTLEARGIIRREGKAIIDSDSGLAYTGDYDLFDIRKGDISGSGIEFESLSSQVQAALRAKPLEVQHGAHLDWKEIPAGMADGYADIIQKSRPGKDYLVEFHPDGKIRYASFDD